MERYSIKTILLTLLLILLWGAVWPINKLAIAYSPPLLYAGLRAFLGGLLLALIIWTKRSELRLTKYWREYLISAIFNIALFFGLHTVGLLYLPAGLFSVIVYVQPILLGLLAWLFLGEYFSSIRLLGLIFGFIGIFIASVDGLTTHVSLIGVILALLTGISWAIGAFYVRKTSSKLNLYWMVVMQNLIGGIILLSIGTIFESWNEITWNPSLVLGVSYGVVFGVSIAYVIYYSLINNGDASKVGVATFLVPIVSVILSLVFLEEVFTLKLLVGIFFVGLSIILVNSRFESIVNRRSDM